MEDYIRDGLVFFGLAFTLAGLTFQEGITPASTVVFGIGTFVMIIAGFFEMIVGSVKKC